MSEKTERIALAIDQHITEATAKLSDAEYVEVLEMLEMYVEAAIAAKREELGETETG